MAKWLAFLVLVELLIYSDAVDTNTTQTSTSSINSEVFNATTTGTPPLLKCSIAFRNWLDLDGSLLDDSIRDLVPGSEVLWTSYYCNSARPLQLIISNRNYGFTCSIESQDPEERMVVTLIDTLAAIDRDLCDNNATELIQLAAEGKECIEALGRTVHYCAGADFPKDQLPLKTILARNFSDADQCKTLADSRNCIADSLGTEPSCSEVQQYRWGQIIRLLIAPCVKEVSTSNSPYITTNAAAITSPTLHNGTSNTTTGASGTSTTLLGETIGSPGTPATSATNMTSIYSIPTSIPEQTSSTIAASASSLFSTEAIESISASHVTSASGTRTTSSFPSATEGTGTTSSLTTSTTAAGTLPETTESNSTSLASSHTDGTSETSSYTITTNETTETYTTVEADNISTHPTAINSATRVQGKLLVAVIAFPVRFCLLTMS